MLNLKKLREEAGFSQGKVGKKIGVKRQTISNIECGIAYPSVKTAKALGKLFNVNWAEFFEDQKSL